MNAFLTGSQVYGIPREDSDVDLVVFMEPSEAAFLACLMEVEIQRSGAENYPVLQFKAGKLNLIVETDERRFRVWMDATESLQLLKPVTRDVAVKFFKQLRKDRGCYESK